MLMPLQFITQILWVQESAPEEYWLVLVTLTGACRGIGGLTFGPYGGALADRYDRRLEPGDASASELFSVTDWRWYRDHRDLARLSNRDRQRLRDWVDAGALDN
jgi:hypothetical protein